MLKPRQNSFTSARLQYSPADAHREHPVCDPTRGRVLEDKERTSIWHPSREIRLFTPSPSTYPAGAYQQLPEGGSLKALPSIPSQKPGAFTTEKPRSLSSPPFESSLANTTREHLSLGLQKSEISRQGKESSLDFPKCLYHDAQLFFTGSNAVCTLVKKVVSQYPLQSPTRHHLDDLVDELISSKYDIRALPLWREQWDRNAWLMKVLHSTEPSHEDATNLENTQRVRVRARLLHARIGEAADSRDSIARRVLLLKTFYERRGIRNQSKAMITRVGRLFLNPDPLGWKHGLFDAVDMDTMKRALMRTLLTLDSVLRTLKHAITRPTIGSAFLTHRMMNNMHMTNIALQSFIINLCNENEDFTQHIAKGASGPTAGEKPAQLSPPGFVDLGTRGHQAETPEDRTTVTDSDAMPIAPGTPKTLRTSIASLPSSTKLRGQPDPRPNRKRRTETRQPLIRGVDHAKIIRLCGMVSHSVTNLSHLTVETVRRLTNPRETKRLRIYTIEAQYWLQEFMEVAHRARAYTRLREEWITLRQGHKVDRWSSTSQLFEGLRCRVENDRISNFNYSAGCVYHRYRLLQYHQILYGLISKKQSSKDYKTLVVPFTTTHRQIQRMRLDILPSPGHYKISHQLRQLQLSCVDVARIIHKIAHLGSTGLISQATISLGLAFKRSCQHVFRLLHDLHRELKKDPKPSGSIILASPLGPYLTDSKPSNGGGLSKTIDSEMKALVYPPNSGDAAGEAGSFDMSSGYKECEDKQSPEIVKFKRLSKPVFISGNVLFLALRSIDLELISPKLRIPIRIAQLETRLWLELFSEASHHARTYIRFRIEWDALLQGRKVERFATTSDLLEKMFQVAETLAASFLYSWRDLYLPLRLLNEFMTRHRLSPWRMFQEDLGSLFKSSTSIRGLLRDVDYDRLMASEQQRQLRGSLSSLGLAMRDIEHSPTLNSPSTGFRPLMGNVRRSGLTYARHLAEIIPKIRDVSRASGSIYFASPLRDYLVSKVPSEEQMLHSDAMAMLRSRHAAKKEVSHVEAPIYLHTRRFNSDKRALGSSEHPSALTPWPKVPYFQPSEPTAEFPRGWARYDSRMDMTDDVASQAEPKSIPGANFRQTETERYASIETHAEKCEASIVSEQWPQTLRVKHPPYQKHLPTYSMLQRSRVTQRLSTIDSHDDLCDIDYELRQNELELRQNELRRKELTLLKRRRDILSKRSLTQNNQLSEHSGWEQNQQLSATNDRNASKIG
ncbi:MAG: hypothetical protein Q9218_005258 [Villophora microphyllina]